MMLLFIESWTILMLCILPGTGRYANSIDTAKEIQQKMFNVSDYGAKGDGVTDDTRSLLSCLTDAYKLESSIIEIPAGKYRITAPLRVKGTVNKSITIRGAGATIPLVFSENYINLLEIQGDAENPSGTVNISNLAFKGNNDIPWSTQHKYYNQKEFRIGVHISNKKLVNIRNVTVRNIFGRGINIVNDKYEQLALDKRYDKVIIEDTKVLDCWGQNVLGENYDIYGDGIYLADVSAAIIRRNTINNDLRKTKQLGRGGLVLEYNVSNCRVENNKINGYDRNIHIERDLGGHIIRFNKLTGSDMGILVYADTEKSKPAAPLEISNNYISNEGMPKDLTLRRIRGDRGLLSFFDQEGIRNGSVIKNNMFVVSDKFSFKNVKNTVVLDRANNARFIQNVFTADLKSSPGIYHYKSAQLQDETYNNTNVYIREGGTMARQQEQVKRGNTFKGRAKIIIY